MADAPVPTTADLARWAEALAGIARTGLAFTESQYEKERYEEVLHVAAEIRSHVDSDFDQNTLVEHWLDSVTGGVPGYITPKVAVGALVANDDGELLLIQRADSGVWLYPTGWCDIGYSPSEVVVKEVEEETGIQVEVERLVAVVDGLRHGWSRVPFYSLVFHARMVGGELCGHELECSDLGFFSQDALPSPLATEGAWAEQAFAAISGRPLITEFDAPRNPPWPAI